METKTIDMLDTEINVQQLLALVKEGSEIVLTEGSTPLARLVPISPPRNTRVAGLHAGAMRTSEDFDEPLPDEFWNETP
ncbi:MAG: toxin-antitoxin (TA) system antitoxin [Thermodesulfobacteriota bacterium]